MKLFGIKKRGGAHTKKTKVMDSDLDNFVLDENSPFAMQEAYKALRTNIIFSIPGEECKVILVTSSIQGEAKSTTAVNLAVAFAQNGSKTLLIDADLRLPTCATKLEVESKPGLSNFLVGMNNYEECLRKLSNGLDLVPAGDVPPNPTELLGSASMSNFLDILKKKYEYIIVDTPPVCTVADASILSSFANGVVLVSRQYIASRESVAEAIRRLEFANAKILGIVFTAVENDKQKSYKKRGYYGYGYEYGKKKPEADGGEAK